MILLLLPFLLLGEVLGDGLHSPDSAPAPSIEGEDEAFWEQKGMEELEAALAMRPNTGVAKNIIIFIGNFQNHFYTLYNL